ncbi:MAG: polysaccharide biosynthesis/export family protein [Litoreibacter sp.]|uniref:polysaccharide biosynthesis/export family protein n=1 Tax=Litoreibacter sp. TaxID=1969459 RepID=UPI003298139E
MITIRLLALCVGLIAGPLWAKSYVIQSGDMLRIEVMEDNSLNRNALVLPDGTIAFPMVGQLQAAGLSLSAVHSALTKGLAPNFAQRPTLHVSVASLARKPAVRTRSAARVVTNDEANTMTVYGMGELEKPGKVSLQSGATLLQFLAQSGGATPYAAMKRVQIRRVAADDRPVKTYRVNVKKLMQGHGNSFLLAPGDVVIVPERKLFE